MSQTITRVPVPGATVITHTQQGLTTALCLSVEFGSRHDPPGLGGTAHLLEHVLMAAPIGAGPSLSERVDELGGSTNATTGLERMLFYAHVRTENAAEVARLLAQAALDPRVGEETLESERRAVLQELAAADADPSDVVQDAYLARLFAGHPLGRPVGGTASEVRRTSADDVMAVHARHLLPRRMALVSVGGLTDDRLHDALDGTPLSRPVTTDRASAEPQPVALSSLGDGGSEVRWPADDFCWMSVGSRGPAASDPRRHAYRVLSYLMSSTATGPLYQRLRVEDGLVYTFHSWYRPYLESGSWRVLAGAETANGPRVLQGIRDTLENIAAGDTTPQALAAARHRALTRSVLDADSPLDAATQIAAKSRSGTVHWSLEEELTWVETVGLPDIAAAAAAVLEDLVIVVRPEPS